MKSIVYLLALVLSVDAGPRQWPWAFSVEVDPTTPPTESSSISTEPFTTTEQTEYQQNTTSPMGTFRKGFAAYEKRINIFIENMRRTYMTMYSDNTKFIGELGKYEDQLPKNKTISVPQRYRETCYCEGRSWSPCPDRCMDSCYYCTYNSCSDNRDNCTEIINEITQCWCYDGSRVTCDNGKLDNCYQWKPVEEPAQEPCVEFAPNRTIIETSYMRFSELLTEPFKKLVRDLDFQLAHLKQAVVATDILNALTLEMCAAQGDTPCLPEATELLAKKLTYFKQLQRNLTLEMIKTQDQAEKVSKNLNDLKEKTFTQMNQAIKQYSCCLKGLSFTVTDNECNTTPAESTTVATSTIETEVEQIEQSTMYTEELRSHRKAQQCLAKGFFLCNNKNCVPEDYGCDGDDDCGDESDEANC